MAVTDTNIVWGGATVLISSDLGTLDSGSGVVISFSQENASVGANVEQLTLPVASWRTSEEITIAFTLLEPTLANIVIAVDSDNTITNGTPPAPNTVDIGDNQSALTNRVVVVTGVAPGASKFARTVTAGEAVLQGGTELKFTKGEATALAMTFLCHYESANSRALLFSDATA